MMGDAAFEIVLAWMVIKSTGSIAALTMILLFQAVPRGILMPLGGAIVDRLSPRNVMLVAHLARAFAFTAITAVAITGTPSVWQLCALALLMGVAAAFFMPASESILPALVPEEHLGRANAFQGVFEQASFLVGPLLGGALIASVGPWSVFALNAATFFLASLTLLAAPLSRPEPTESLSPRQVAREIAEGLGHAKRSHEVRLVLAIICAATLSYSGVFAVGLPALAQTMGDAMALGVIVSGWGAGQIVGVLLATMTGLPRRWGVLIIGMNVVEAGMFAALGFMPTAWAAAALLFVVGIGVAYSSDVALPTFIQTQTPRHLLGRISALLGLPRVVLEPLSIALLGLVLTRSIQWGFLVAAIPVLLVGAALALDPKARTLSASPSEKSAHETSEPSQADVGPGSAGASNSD